MPINATASARALALVLGAAELGRFSVVHHEEGGTFHLISPTGRQIDIRGEIVRELPDA